MSSFAIETAGLRKQYGRKLAVSDLTLSVPRGEIFGFLGPNGAGKTTSIKMLLGLVRPGAGEGLLLGAPIGDRAARARVGFLPEHFRFQDWLSGRAFLRTHGRLLGLGGAALEARIDALLARMDLGDAADRELRGYSKGMLQRVGLAQAMLNAPDLIFLDEPTSGLDPIGRMLVRDVLKELRDAGTTIFLNSHQLGEVEAVCTRVAFVKGGRVVRELDLADADAGGGVEVTVKAAGVNAEALADLRALGTLAPLDARGETFLITLDDEARLPEIARVLVLRGAQVLHVAAQRPSLESIFIETMGSEGRAG